MEGLWLTFFNCIFLLIVIGNNVSYKAISILGIEVFFFKSRPVMKEI